jgi:hypothetical protein
MPAPTMNEPRDLQPDSQRPTLRSPLSPMPFRHVEPAKRRSPGAYRIVRDQPDEAPSSQSF